MVAFPTNPNTTVIPIASSKIFLKWERISILDEKKDSEWSDLERILYYVKLFQIIRF